MNYIPTKYSILDNITVDKLNKIENAVANITNNFVILEMKYNSNQDQFFTVNTFQEIYNLVSNGKLVFFKSAILDEQENYSYHYGLLRGIDISGLYMGIQVDYGIIHFQATSLDSIATQSMDE